MTREWKIGDVVIPNRSVLAPMAGVTDLAFRSLCKEQGAGLICMEMVSAKAISYHNQHTKELMRVSPAEHPVSLQLFGKEPELMGEVAAMIDPEPFDILDLNMGCPVPKVVNNGEGSALLKDPELIERIVAAVSRNTKKPVTVKMRIGFEGSPVDPAEIARRAEAAGAAAIAVHGRTRQQYYSGKADWEAIRRVKEAVTIPVIGNGDVVSLASAKAMMEQTGCDAVMAGRAARGNPWIFRQLSVGLGEISPGENVTDIAGEQSDPSADRKKIRLEINRGKRETADNEEILTARSTGDDPGKCGVPGTQEVMEMILRHARLVIEYSGEAAGMRQMRKHIAWYTAGMKHSSSLRREANTLETYAQLEELLRSYEGS